MPVQTSSLTAVILSLSKSQITNVPAIIVAIACMKCLTGACGRRVVSPSSFQFMLPLPPLLLCSKQDSNGGSKDMDTSICLCMFFSSLTLLDTFTVYG